MSEPRCIGEPISFLKLERLALDELEGTSKRSVEEHLARCASCRSALETIREDERALPPLLVEKTPKARVLRPVWGTVATVIALAAGALLFVQVSKPQRDQVGEQPQVRAKGGEAVLSIVNANGQPTDTFADGDRVQLLLTCTEEQGTAWDVTVLENGVSSTPLPQRNDVLCGNRVPFGTLRLSGKEPLTICVSSGQVLGVGAKACQVLRPAP